MNERDVRLLFEAGHWSSATVRYDAQEKGWLIDLNVSKLEESHQLTLKRGKARIFKTSDAALNWCREIGFHKITVQLQKSARSEIHQQQDNPPTILLVEDNSSDIELTLRAIQFIDKNLNMVVCRDGQEALDFLFANNQYASRDISELPQLILLDLKLPKLNGLDVLEMIRKNEQTSSIPVVILTTSDEENDIRESYRIGINSYVRKPLEYDVFCETIRQLGNYWLYTNTSPFS